MKTNKQFIDEIYQKYNEYTLEKQNNRNRNIRKIVNIAAVFIVILSSFIVFLEKETPKQVQNLAKEETKLSTVENFENFYNVIKNRYSSNQVYKSENAVVQDAIIENVGLNSTNSKTNIQVEDVDEADIVKVDNKYIYYVAGNKVVIINTENPENSQKIAEINYEGQNLNPREIYIYENKLIVIANEYDNICKTETSTTNEMEKYDVAINTEYKSKSGIIIYDVSNVKEPKEIRRVMVEGTYITSRMIDSNIYMVANKNIYSTDILKNEIEDLDQEDYKPQYIDTRVSTEEKCINYDQIYLLDGTDEANYLMLVGLNVDSNEDADIKTFLGAGEYIYASEKNMYIAINKIEYGDGYEVIGSNTHILKFSIESGKFTFVAEKNVEGIVNNQFSMDENNSTFRIATTLGNQWSINENTKNNLYILNENLEEIGKIEGFAQEEKIYSVRYVDDKAYIVTFKQTDPLFVIDLSTPSNPQILGELKLPGYSTYLHPYDENHIIGFGYETKENGTEAVTDGLKMVMFDVSDFTNPKVLFKMNIGDKYTYSELLSNHKALLFSKENSIIAFPIYSSLGNKTNSRAAIYEIDMENGFLLKGEVGNVTKDYNEEIKRIVIANNNYYALSNSLVKVADMKNVSVINEFDI